MEDVFVEGDKFNELIFLLASVGKELAIDHVFSLGTDSDAMAKVTPLFVHRQLQLEDERNQVDRDFSQRTVAQQFRDQLVRVELWKDGAVLLEKPPAADNQVAELDVRQLVYKVLGAGQAGEVEAVNVLEDQIF